MAEIKESTPIAPVLPASTGNNLRRTPVRQKPPRERDAHERRHPAPPDDDHHVDEYA